MNADVVSRTELLEDVYERVAHRAEVASLDAVTVGERQLLVELHHPHAERTAGVAVRPAEDVPTVSSTVRKQARCAFDDRVGQRALGVATLNALATPDIAWQSGDPMDLLPEGMGRIATVGLFWRAFEKIDAREIRVVERDPSSVKDTPEHVAVYGPDEADVAFEDVEVCFLTGSTLVYGGLAHYLAVLRRLGDPVVVLIGATASMCPEPFFDAGVDVIAGARVRDIPAVRAGIADDDCGTDLHEVGLEKVYATATDTNGFDIGGGST